MDTNDNRFKVGDFVYVALPGGKSLAQRKVEGHYSIRGA